MFDSSVFARRHIQWRHWFSQIFDWQLKWACLEWAATQEVVWWSSVNILNTKPRQNTSVKNQMYVQRGRIQEFRMNGWRMEMFLYMTTPEQESWWCFLESWKLQMQEHTGVEWKYLAILRASLNFSWASDTVRNRKYCILCVYKVIFLIFM